MRDNDRIIELIDEIIKLQDEKDEMLEMLINDIKEALKLCEYNTTDEYEDWKSEYLLANIKKVKLIEKATGKTWEELND